MSIMNSMLKQKKSGRINSLCTLYEGFCEKYSKNTNNSFYLNKDLLYLAVISYFDDIEKFKEYSGSPLADQYKQAAFTIKWISKIKPIQIYPDVEVNKHILLINSLYAIFTGMAFLLEVTPESIPSDYYEHLIYTTLYRDVDAKQLAGALFLLEKYTIGNIPKSIQTNGEKN